jgi:thioredoxin-related protein
LKRIVLLAVFALLLAPQTFAGAWNKSVAAAQKTAKEKNQLIFVDMFAEWCGWCHRFEQEVFPSMVFQQATDDMVLLRLNTEDNSEGTQLARKHQVTSLPTFLVLAPDLSVAGIIRGYAPPNDFVKMLKDTRGKYDDFVKRAGNENAIAKDYPKRLELAKEYVTRGAYDKSEARLRKLTTERGVPAAVRDAAYYELAVSFVLQNKLADGAKTVRELTTKSKAGEPVERSRVLLGQILMQQGDLQGAANELRSFKAAFPNSALIRTVDMVLPDIERRLAAK